jgi:hypothetical protein
MSVRRFLGNILSQVTVCTAGRASESHSALSRPKAALVLLCVDFVSGCAHLTNGDFGAFVDPIDEEAHGWQGKTTDETRGF